MFLLKSSALMEESGTNIFMLVPAHPILSPLLPPAIPSQSAVSEKCTIPSITNANVLSVWLKETQFVLILNAVSDNITTTELAKSLTALLLHSSARIDASMEIPINAVSVIIGMELNVSTTPAPAHPELPGLAQIVKTQAAAVMVSGPMEATAPHSHNNAPHQPDGMEQNAQPQETCAPREPTPKVTNASLMKLARTVSSGMLPILDVFAHLD